MQWYGMRWLSGIIGGWLCFLCLLGVAWGGTLGDVNGDGAVGLPEAMNALQVTAGLRTPTSDSLLGFRKYFYVENGTYEYNVTSYGVPPAVPTPTVSTAIYHISAETVNGVPLLVVPDYQSSEAIPITYKGYYSIGSADVSYAGYSLDSGGITAFYWYNPAIIIGTSEMAKGDLIPNFYRITDTTNITTSGFDESTVLGLEDVTVPAGTFMKCLKVLRKNSTYSTAPTSSYATTNITVYYYAENVGPVKILSQTGKKELRYAKIGSAVYPQGAIRYAGTFSKTQDNATIGSGTFTFISSAANVKTKGTIILSSLVPPSVESYMVVSTDGVNLTADPDVYGDNPPTVNLVVSASPCTVSGSIVSSAAVSHHGGSGEPTTPPVITTTLSGSCLQ